jgi:NAD(P)-dependent dehydrogenase (short-subunit alcohol dehydrogenase family)
MRLDGLAAAVPGAGRGIGRAAALALAQAGANVVPISRTRADLDDCVVRHGCGGCYTSKNCLVMEEVLAEFGPAGHWLVVYRDRSGFQDRHGALR